LRISKDASAARKDLQIAERLDPFNPWYPRWEAYAAVAQGNEVDATRLAQRVKRIDPAFAYNGDAMAMVEAAFGHWRACVDRYTQQHAKLSTSSPQLAICRAHTGATAQARATLQTLLADAQHHYVDRTYIAAIYAALGEKDDAMAQLEQAFRDRSAHMNSLWLNPWYRPLRADPRFESLIARIAAGGLPSAAPGGTASTAPASP
jgi:tetratricopeptide (TPR) repeat protein